MAIDINEICTAVNDAIRNTIHQHNPDIEVNEVPFELVMNLSAISLGSMVHFLNRETNQNHTDAIIETIQNRIEQLKRQEQTRSAPPSTKPH